jgi:hypothetical protein
MELKTGTLDDLWKVRQWRRQRFTVEERHDIVDQLRGQLLCLARYKDDQERPLLYTDLKLSNVLYHEDNNRIVVQLGDIGSMAANEEGLYPTSFPFWHYDLVQVTRDGLTGYLKRNLHLLPESAARECVPYMLAHLFVQLGHGKALTIKETDDEELYPDVDVQGLIHQMIDSARVLSKGSAKEKMYASWFFDQETFWDPPEKQVVVGPTGRG